jgi:hypothetical protein
MKNSSDLKWYATISIFLLLLSIISYSIQIYIFHHESDTYFYLLQDISFVPIQVLIVTFFIDRLLKKQQRINVLKRVNVTIGIFFSELGNELLKYLFEVTDNKQELANKLEINAGWKINNFKETEKWIAGNPVKIHLTPENIALLKDFFDKKRLFILDLLENSNLPEHDTFTDTLLAVSHLSDELALRTNLEHMPAADLNHLIIDIKRAYHGIIKEWIVYMNHIKKEYPFLFSLALRSNPFNNKCSVVIYDS